MVGLVLVSHSEDIAKGLAELAGQMAGPDVPIHPAGGLPDGSLGTDDDRVRDAIRHANSGDGVVVIGDLGSAILTVRHVLERAVNGNVVLADAPFVEGAIAAAVVASVGAGVDEVARAAEEARGANKL
ncbi:MAG: dihydroxyacetone kinase phosphoryl donor subunit DhaM [Thermoleophilaceae bacterium]